MKYLENYRRNPKFRKVCRVKFFEWANNKFQVIKSLLTLVKNYAINYFFAFYRKNVRPSPKAGKQPSSSAKVTPSKKRLASVEAVSFAKEKQANKSAANVIKEKKPTRHSPRRIAKDGVEKYKRYVQMRMSIEPSNTGFFQF